MFGVHALTSWCLRQQRLPSVRSITAVMLTVGALLLPLPQTIADDVAVASSDKLECRLVAVSHTSNDERPDEAKVAGMFPTGREMTFLVELKNVSPAPVTLLGVRYGDSYPTAKGRLNTSFYGPHLFKFEFFDSQGHPVARAERAYASQTLVLNGASTHDLQPGESLSMIVRPGQFVSPMEYRLDPGHYRATVRYTGPGDDVVEKIKKHWPKSKQGDAWQGVVESNSVEFAIDEPVGRAKPELNFGPTVDGLQAAIEFEVPKYIQETPHDAPGIPLKSAVGVYCHVRNVSDKAITFASETSRQGDTIEVVDSTGKKVDVASAWFSGWPIDVRWVLQPGDSARLFILTPGVTGIKEPGMYSVRYTLRFNSRQMKDDKGNVIFPKAEDYKSDLTTGETLLFFRKRTPADDERAKPPSFDGRVVFADPDGNEIESGKFTFSGQIRRKDHTDLPVQKGGTKIAEATEKVSRIFVRAPGFEEASFHQVKLKAGKSKTLTLKPAAKTTFRLVSAVDGKPVAKAKIRHFVKTSAKASSGPYPTKGTGGEIWTYSDEDGRVVLDSLQRINPVYEKLGDAIYHFYVEPADAHLAPRFVGPIKAGKDLGEIKLGSWLEVRGEVHGTKEELDRFSAEWDQPEVLVRDNPQATWMYAQSKRLKTKREGDKLTFHLEGLRPGRFRIVASFAKRPHSVSHSYSRRDPKGSDRVIEFQLDKPYIGLVLTSESGDDATTWNEKWKAEKEGRQNQQASQNQVPAPTISLEKFEPFDCTIIDAVSGEPIAGDETTISLRFREPHEDPTQGKPVGNLIWPRSKSDFKFVIPDNIVDHPLREQLVVHWGIGHPNYKPASGTVPLKEIVDKASKARDRLSVVRLVPVDIDYQSVLDQQVSIKQMEKPLVGLISHLEETYHVPVTIDLGKLKKLGVTLHQKTTIKTHNAELREVYKLIGESVGVTVDFDDSGVTIPGKGSRITIHYHHPGGADEARIFVQHINGVGEIGTVDEDQSKWSPVENGKSVTLKDLQPGDYQVARMCNVDLAKAGLGRVSQGLFLDRNRFDLLAGQAKSVRFVRQRSKVVAGSVVDFDKTKLERGVVMIAAKGTSDSPEENLGATLFEAVNCGGDGRFETPPLGPGEYVAVFSGYEDLTNDQLFTTGVPVPRWKGTKAFVVPADGKVPAIEIPIRDVKPPS